MAKHMKDAVDFAQARQLDDTYVMHTYGRLPVEFVAGNGAELTDADGKVYLDFLAGIGCASMGHANPDIAAAIKAQLDEVWQVGNYYYVEHRGELAQAISELLSTTTDEQGHVTGSTDTVWKSFFNVVMLFSPSEISSAMIVERGTVMITSMKVFFSAWRK